jgi:hypothetical protein
MGLPPGKKKQFSSNISLLRFIHKGKTADSRDSESLGIRWEAREYDGNPGNLGNPRNPTRIQGIRWESREYDQNPGNLGNTKSAVSPLIPVLIYSTLLIILRKG